jgi:hypothetical protein
MSQSLPRIALVLLVALMLPAAPRAAPRSAPPDPFLAQLAGAWDLVGTVQGKPVHTRGTGRWVLRGGWLCLSLSDRSAPPGYEASVYFGYDDHAHDYIAHWLDQFGAAGARVVATGRRDGQTLVLVFPYPEGAFRDTLELAADGNSGSLLLESQEKDGSWTTFASYHMRRAHRAPAAPGRTLG